MININFVFKENKNEAIKQLIESIAGGVIYKHNLM